MGDTHNTRQYYTPLPAWVPPLPTHTDGASPQEGSGSPRPGGAVKEFRAGIVALSERPLLCMDVDEESGTVLCGGADHSLYVVGYGRGEGEEDWVLGVKGICYPKDPKEGGHSEWINCCKIVPQNGSNSSLISAGLDSKICIWTPQHSSSFSSSSSSLTRRKSVPDSTTTLRRAYGCAATIQMHTASCSRILTPTPGAHEHDQLVLSSGYDGMIKLWSYPQSCRGKYSSSEVQVLRGLKATGSGAVLDICWPGSYPSSPPAASSSVVVSGSRDGKVVLWDLEVGKAVAVLKGHKAPTGYIQQAMPLTSCSPSPPPSSHHLSPLFFSGSLDGTVRCWDIRNKTCAHVIQAHVATTAIGTGGSSPAKRAAVEGYGISAMKTFALGASSSSSPWVVTAGADSTIKVFDLRNAASPFAAFENSSSGTAGMQGTSNSIYGLDVIEDPVPSASGGIAGLMIASCNAQGKTSLERVNTGVKGPISSTVKHPHRKRNMPSPSSTCKTSHHLAFAHLLLDPSIRNSDKPMSSQLSSSRSSTAAQSYVIRNAMRNVQFLNRNISAPAIVMCGDDGDLIKCNLY
eukprot:Nk52_evm13s1671 gene=Nk52_evmTU13s1671